MTAPRRKRAATKRKRTTGARPARWSPSGLVRFVKGTPTKMAGWRTTWRAKVDPWLKRAAPLIAQLDRVHRMTLIDGARLLYTVVETSPYFEHLIGPKEEWSPEDHLDWLIWSMLCGGGLAVSPRGAYAISAPAVRFYGKRAPSLWARCLPNASAECLLLPGCRTNTLHSRDQFGPVYSDVMVHRLDVLRHGLALRRSAGAIPWW